VRVFGYLKHHPKHRICLDNSLPNYEGLKFLSHDWSTTYPGAEEDLPDDTPPAMTREMAITVYVDSSHGDDLVTRRSTTGIMLCINKAPIKTISKWQNTVETSTYGSELVASRQACELILEYRYKLRMIGLKVTKPSVLLVDNEAVVYNSTLPSSTLKKKHNAISYHKVREAVAVGIIKVAHVASKDNRADLFTKPLSGEFHYNLTKDILFTRSQSGKQGE
jgi:hypothetical protein